VEKAESALDRANQAAITADAAVQACDRIEQEMSALEQTFDQTVKKSLNHTNVKLFQPFERQLTSENLEIFTKIWLPTLGLPLNSKALGYLAHHICLCEDACSGRLATTVQDMLLRILVARSVQNPELSVLEVGSLFGINLAAIYDLCRDYFKTVHLTAVDPLDGYYGQSYTDLITQVPITRKIFEHNMRQVDVPVQDITLIQGLSTEDMVLERVGLKQYNLLIIDGDHSYAGVKFDFDHYLSAMDLGGYIIFDDYGSSDWPDVAEFVDNEVKPNPCVEFVGASWRTAVFKVIRRNLR
jgi:cephalosporin hydroxylase